ncbi:MAG: hypothetical protein DDT40_00855 [candidate division WS2 bacterium]|nr:hypothetical protein [Candidatus Psychracetigena formicireducens]
MTNFIPTYISTATTTIVSSRPSVLHSIVVTETAAGTITIRDGIRDIAVFRASIVEGTYLFDALCETNLTVITTAASRITVNWRPTV